MKSIKYKNVLRQTLKNEEKNYYETQFLSKANDARKTWKIINSLLNKNSKKEVPCLFKINNTNTSDSKEIVNAFNKFFVEIGPRLAEKISPPKLFHSVNSTSFIKDSMVIFPVDPQEIYNIIQSLKNTTACGVDQIPISVIKSVSKSISSPLASLINHSVANGIFPDRLKVAKVIPIYKSGDKSQISNYRPISLLNTFSKIYEKFLLSRLETYLNKNSILYDGQFDFRKKRSTALALASFLDIVTEALDNSQYALSLFIDLSKAFDTIDHSLLLKKLSSYGIRGLALDLIKDYLSNRYQFVEINGVPSELMSISCGVPQGSILGPMLFLLYINDMYTCTKILKLILFADDTTIVFTSNDLNKLIRTVNKELVLLSDWFALNKLSLNSLKTNYMIFKNNNLDSPLPDLILDGVTVTRVQSVKFLGVLVDEKLTWKNHVTVVEKKLSSASFILRKIRYKITQRTALTLYDTLILPHVMYCNIVWGNTCKSYTSNIVRLQKRALRTCLENKNLTTHGLFIAAMRLPFVNIHNFQIAQLVYHYFYNDQVLPKCIIALFDKISEIHQHATRSLDNRCLHTHFARLNIRKNSIKICAPVLWNKISINLRQIKFIEHFKTQYRLHLLKSLNL